MTKDHDAYRFRSRGLRAARKVGRVSLLSSVAGVIAVLAGAFSALTQVAPAGAVDNTGQFEMDGNIAHDAAATPPYDWASLFDASGHRLVTPDPVNGPLLASTFLSDAAVPDSSYFSSNGAGVKDLDTLNNWGCTSINNPTPKDDVENAYAALFTIPAGATENAGDTVLYLGSERGSNNGTSFAGFWLFKDKTVACNTSTGSFDGAHQVGDLLVVSDYTNGGSSQDVSVYKWVGGNNPLSLVLSGGVCPTPPTGTPSDDACAIANPITNPPTAITSPWAPTSHDGNTFVEAAVDLTNLFASQGGGDCFTTFMAETRSSNQLTATLKDFSGGQLNTCFAPPIVTTATPGGSSNLPGAAQHDVATITGAPGKAAPTGTITFTLCGPSDVDSTGCPTGKGTTVGTAVPVSGGGAKSIDVNGGTTPGDLTPGKYCWRADYTPDAASTNLYDPSTDTNATTECFTVVKASPTITTQIQVTGSGGLVVTSYGDTATLHSFVGTVTGETVTFNLFGPYATGVTPTCATGVNEPVFTTTGTLNASGVATTSSTFTPTAAGQYVWVAHYPGDSLNGKADGACTDSNEQGTITPPVIHVDKTADAASVSAGTGIGFTVTVSNSGAGTATGLALTDALPGGNAATPVHWVIDTTKGNPTSFSITGNDGSQALNLVTTSLASGGSLSVHVTAVTGGTSCATYDNTAKVTTGNDGTDTHSASTTVLCPSVGVTKTADAATVSAGQAIGYTVTVSNAGPGNATGVTLSDAMPGGNAATPVHWTIDNTKGNPAAFAVSGADGSQHLTLAGQPVALASGASLSVHVVAATAPTSCAVYDNSATAAPSNGTSANVGPVAITVQCPNLGIVKTAVPAGPVSTGDQIGFTVTVSNSSAAGTGTAFGVTMSDPLPAGSGINWSISPAYAGPGTCSISGAVGSQELDCSLGDMLPGASAAVSIVSPTTGSSAGHYDNTATAQASNNAPVQSTAGVTVLAPGLNLSKTADSASVASGQAIGFTISVLNAGPGIATAAAINDPLPSATDVSWSISPAYTGPGTCSITAGASGQTLVCSLGDLAAGATASVHVTSATTTASCTTFPNTATASAGNQAPVQASATTSVVCGQVLGITTPNTGAAPDVRSSAGLIGSGLVLLLTGFGLRRRHRAVLRHRRTR